MLKIIPYQQKYHAEFRRLNLEWLEAYNLVESHDLEILDDPEGTLIAGGGKLFLALEADQVVGTAGIWKINNEEYELVKMAVDPDFRGKGISKQLLEKCLEEVRTLGGKKMLLFSNSQLKTALKLYEQYGFNYVEATDSPFATADVKMELAL
jgi:GNAT superfamily N-acetyltransferase